MSAVFTTMYTFFQNSKLEGGYLLLFALSLVVLYVADDNRNKWLALYPVVLILLVVANPLTIWLLSQVFPVLANYEQVAVLIPVLIYIPFGAVELISGLKDHRERGVVSIVLFLFIAISGNMFGIFDGDTRTTANKYNDERKEIIAYANNVAEQGGLVLGDDEILPFITSYGDNVPLLYGQDLMTFNGDLGIMDTYDDGIFQIHNLMWTPEEDFESIAAMASGYGCDIIIMNKFENWPERAGNYRIDKQTPNYLIYRHY